MLGRPVPAGFPSPADDYLENPIDLHKHLVEHPAATFMMRVSGYSMVGVGILDGDMIVVDRSLDARSGHIVVAIYQGDLTVKRLKRLKDGRMVLRSENPDYPDFLINDCQPAEIWGVVVGVVRKLATG